MKICHNSDPAIASSAMFVMMLMVTMVMVIMVTVVMMMIIMVTFIMIMPKKDDNYNETKDNNKDVYDDADKD